MSHAPTDRSQMPAGCSGACNQGRAACECDREVRPIRGTGLVLALLITGAAIAVGVAASQLFGKVFP